MKRFLQLAGNRPDVVRK